VWFLAWQKRSPKFAVVVTLTNCPAKSQSAMYDRRRHVDFSQRTPRCYDDNVAAAVCWTSRSQAHLLNDDWIGCLNTLRQALTICALIVHIATEVWVWIRRSVEVVFLRATRAVRQRVRRDFLEACFGG